MTAYSSAVLFSETVFLWMGPLFRRSGPRISPVTTFSKTQRSYSNETHRISGEVANIHMRTNAKNLVLTARTINLLNRKETIRMIFMLRKEARTGNIQDLAHIPTQNFLADCLTKADNLIIAVETGRLSEVDVHPNFRTLMERKAFLSTWCRTFMHTREKEVFFLSALRIPLAPTPQKKDHFR